MSGQAHMRRLLLQLPQQKKTKNKKQKHCPHPPIPPTHTRSCGRRNESVARRGSHGVGRTAPPCSRRSLRSALHSLTPAASRGACRTPQSAAGASSRPHSDGRGRHDGARRRANRHLAAAAGSGERALGGGAAPAARTHALCAPVCADLLQQRAALRRGGVFGQRGTDARVERLVGALD